MAGVNRVILIGNLGKDPEIRSLEGGVKVANFPSQLRNLTKERTGRKSIRPSGIILFYGGDWPKWPKTTLRKETAFMLKVRSVHATGPIKMATSGIPLRSLPTTWLCLEAGGISPITAIILPLQSRKNRRSRSHRTRILICPRKQEMTCRSERSEQ
jgi:hypothetical protein